MEWNWFVTWYDDDCDRRLVGRVVMELHALCGGGGYATSLQGIDCGEGGPWNVPKHLTRPSSMEYAYISL